jgi:2-polyprenyl-6-methoxyphenol hydroxylase-like FAD-dependent oxidoreductase
MIKLGVVIAGGCPTGMLLAAELKLASVDVDPALQKILSSPRV